VTDAGASDTLGQRYPATLLDHVGDLVGGGQEVGRRLERDRLADGVGLCPHLSAGLGGGPTDVDLNAGDDLWTERPRELSGMRQGRGRPREP
jgi:hypothetical protein